MYITSFFFSINSGCDLLLSHYYYAHYSRMIKLVTSVYDTYLFPQFFSLYICIFFSSFTFYLSQILHQTECISFSMHTFFCWVTSIMFLTRLPLTLVAIKPEGDSGSYGSVGSPVGGPECRSAEFDGLQAQCDQAMHQLQLLRHKHSDTIRRFVLIMFQTFFFSLSVTTFPFASFFHLRMHIFSVTYRFAHFASSSHTLETSLLG